MDNVQLAFRALADPTRRDILVMLSDGDMSIGEVAGHFDITRAAVKKHLSMLNEGGLITVRASGRERINAINKSGFVRANKWLSFFDHFWDEKLVNLKTAIEKEEIK